MKHSYADLCTARDVIKTFTGRDRPVPTPESMASEYRRYQFVEANARWSMLDEIQRHIDHLENPRRE